MPVNSDRRRPGLAGGVVRGGEDDHDGFGITEGIGEDVNDEIVITEWTSEGVRDEFVKTGLSGEDVMDEFVITEGTGEDFIVEIQIIGEDAGPWARGDLPGAKRSLDVGRNDSRPFSWLPHACVYSLAFIS